MIFTPMRLFFLQHDRKCQPEGPAFAESYKAGIKIMLWYRRMLKQMDFLLLLIDLDSVLALRFHKMES